MVIKKSEFNLSLLTPSLQKNSCVFIHPYHTSKKSLRRLPAFRDYTLKSIRYIDCLPH